MPDPLVLKETFDLLLTVVAELLKRMPTYEQKKRKQFFDLLSDYREEQGREKRDDDRVTKCRRELHLFASVFAREIGQKDLPTLQPDR